MIAARRRLDLSIAGSCLFLSALTMVLSWTSPIARSLCRGERITGLLIGSDYEDNTRHSDTLMVVSYDPGRRFLDILSIPRDTMVSIPTLGRVKRINEVFAYEFKHTGRNFDLTSSRLTSEVAIMLSSGSFHPLVIPYYFTIDYSGFRSLIDLMGGIYVRVYEPMNYDDSWGHLHIHFQPSPEPQWLNGKRALEYVRFRGGSADQGRVRRQQLFIKEILKRLKNPALLWRLPTYTKTFLAGFHTNASMWDLVTLFVEGRRLDWHNLRPLSLPGKPNGQLWEMNVENTQRIVALMTSPAPSRAALARAEAHSAATWHGKPTVEVWNASDRPNAAKAVTVLLRDKGFDVVKFGNFSTRQQQTLVVDRSGDLRPAQAVAEALQSATPDVVSRPDQSLQVDVSVIVGNDYPITDERWKP